MWSTRMANGLAPIHMFYLIISLLAALIFEDAENNEDDVNSNHDRSTFVGYDSMMRSNQCQRTYDPSAGIFVTSI